MTNKQLAFQKQTDLLIKNLSKRNIEGSFFENSTALCNHLREILPKNCSVTWGGSETLKESGVMNLLTNGDYQAINRSDAKTKEDQRKLYAKQILSDYFFMSTNAITFDGELINIDGNSNRVGCLVHGPEHVFIIVGMNKLVSDIPSGIKRIQNIASPANGIRLQKNTPCAITGQCGNCFSSECMCNQIVITRRSGHPGRIQVFFVAENLGY